MHIFARCPIAKRELIRRRSQLLDQAARIYSAPLSRQFFLPEMARVHYKRSLALRTLGREEAAKENSIAALKLYRDIRPGDRRGLESLSVEDFDNRIMFWSR